MHAHSFRLAPSLKSFRIGVVLTALLLSVQPLFAQQADTDLLWQQQGVAFPSWMRNQTVYELNTRQFSEEGTFKGVEAQLERLHELGVNTLWFMPVQPYGQVNRKGELGSYYSIQDYTGINPEYGSPEDFSRLVKKAERCGKFDS